MKVLSVLAMILIDEKGFLNQNLSGNLQHENYTAERRKLFYE